MRVLVTGGGGFIGSHVVEKLIENNHEPVILTKDCNKIDRIRHLEGKYDIYNGAAYRWAFQRKKIDAVIHLATLYKKEDDETSLEEMYRTNIEFPGKILNEMLKNDTKYFIDTGTFFEYELSGSFIDEFVKKKPYNLYATTKTAFNEISDYYTDKIKKVNLKLFSPYGPKDNSKLITNLGRALANDKEIEVTKGDQELSFTYVKDIAEAYIKALDYLVKEDYNGVRYENFNICSPSVKLSRVFDLLEEISSKKDLIKRTREYSKNEVMFGRGKNYLANKHLGWDPKYTIEEGLRETYDYYLKEAKDGI